MKENQVLKKYPHIHTGRELELMLAGLKPMAWFYDAVVCLPDEDIIPESKFAVHVESGVILRDELLLESSHKAIDGQLHTIKHVFYALKAEKWRIEAMKLLKSEFNLTGRWNETCERFEGKLLGYTEKENDLWCKGRFNKL